MFNPDNVSRIIAYEQGELSEDDTINLFQDMINDGSVWSLQGHYGRTAKQLILGGHCVPKLKLNIMD